MSTPKNTTQKGKSPTIIDSRYFMKAFGICFITFVIGIFIGKTLTPTDSVQDLKKQIKQTDPKDKFTFFYTLPNKNPDKTLPQKTSIPRSTQISPKKNLSQTSKNHIPKSNQNSFLHHDPIPADKKYTIQVGSFKKQNEAEQLSQRLKNKGYSAYLTRADLGNKGVWYRVKVGRFSSLPETKIQLQNLNAKTGLKGFVTKIK